MQRVMGSESNESLQRYLSSLPWDNPEKLLAAISSIENVFLSSFSLREMFNHLQRNIQPKSPNTNPVHYKETEEEIWKEIQVLWKKRQRDLEILRNNHQPSNIMKKLSLLVSSLQGIIEWLELSLNQEGEIISSYNWLVKQSKEKNPDREGEYFSFSSLATEMPARSQWKSPSKSKPNTTRVNNLLGSRTNIERDKKHQSVIPQDIASGKLECSLKKYRKMLDCLKRLYPLIRVKNYSEELETITNNHHVVDSLKNFRDILSDDFTKIHNCLESVGKISTGIEEIHECLNNSKKLLSPKPSLSELLTRVEKIENLIEPISTTFHTNSSTLEPTELNLSNVETLLSNTKGWDTDELGSCEISEISLEKLLDLIITGGDMHPRKVYQIKRVFLETLPYFTNVNHVLDHLFLRYCAVPTTLSTMNGLEPFERVREELQVPIRAEIARFLRSWTKRFYNRDFAIEEHQARVRNFVTKVIAVTGNPNQTQVILEILRNHNTDGSNLGFPLPTPDRFAQIPFSVTQVKVHSHLEFIQKSDPLQLAHQLTSFEFYEFYCKINEEELLNQCWNKEETKHKSKHITHSIRHFNRVSAWIVESILSYDKLENRVMVLKRLLVVGLHLLRLNNFNGLIEIISALSNCSIERLYKTWHSIGKEYNYIFATLNLLIQNKMKLLKHLWEQADAGIPYIGTFLTDLTFIENSSSTFTEKGMINFSKMMRIHNTIETLLKAQSIPYDTEAHESFQELFTHLPDVTDPEANEDRWFSRSMELESNEEIREYPKFQKTFPTDVSEAAEVILQLLDHEIVKTVAFSPTNKSSEVEETGTERLSATNNSSKQKYSFSIVEVQNVVDTMKSEIFTFKKRHNMRTYRDTFIGHDGVDWLMEHFSFSEVQAQEYGNMLIEAGFITPLTSACKTFKNDDGTYRFVEYSKDVVPTSKSRTPRIRKRTTSHSRIFSAERQ